MKIVIAPDSFKDSLSAEAVAAAIAEGLAEALPEAELLCCPMADGGEGTVEAILVGLQGVLKQAQVNGPLGAPVTARWGWVPDVRMAVIEMAEASGLQLLGLAQRDATRSSSYGTGQLILQALDVGARKVVLTIGGSATNDGGAGMLSALGARWLGADGAPLAPGGLALANLATVDLSQLDPRLEQVEFEVAADVDNPLCGPHGASHVFGPQKGASAQQVAALDSALEHFAEGCAQALGRDMRHEPGSGAAGGMGFAAKMFLGASFRPGVDVVAELVGLADKVRGADWVITGEGRCDQQTLRGKTPIGVARVAQRAGVPVVLLAGTLGEGYEAIYQHGINAAFALAPGPISLAEACEQAPRLLRERARDIARLWAAARQA